VAVSIYTGWETRCPYRRLLLQVFASCRLCAKVRPHAVVLPPAVYPAPGRSDCVEDGQLRYASLPACSHRPQRAAVGIPLLFWDSTHKPLPVVAFVLVVIGVVVKGVCERAVCIVGKRVVGEEAARSGGGRGGAAVERWGWRGGDRHGRLGALRRVGRIVVVVRGYLCASHRQRRSLGERVPLGRGSADGEVWGCPIRTRSYRCGPILARRRRTAGLRAWKAVVVRRQRTKRAEGTAGVVGEVASECQARRYRRATSKASQLAQLKSVGDRSSALARPARKGKGLSHCLVTAPPPAYRAPHMMRAYPHARRPSAPSHPQCRSPSVAPSRAAIQPPSSPRPHRPSQSTIRASWPSGPRIFSAPTAPSHAQSSAAQRPMA
jgi:hypothetical protein